MHPKKRYGQHFLLPQWADKVVAAIDPQPGDRFLEIGSGPGVLTTRLAPRVAHLTAVEVDREMVDLLTPGLPANVTLVHQDFLDTTCRLARGRLRRPAPGGGQPALQRVLADHVPPDRAHKRHGTLTDATLMLQREVAERIEAGPGSKTTVCCQSSVQLHADVRRVLSLPPGAFRPAPKVHSSVIQLRFRPPAVALTRRGRVRSHGAVDVHATAQDAVERAQAICLLARADAAAALASAGIDPARRPETLQLDELARLADFFSAPKGG